MAIKGRLTTYPGAYMSEKDFAILMDAVTAEKGGILHGCNVTVSGTTLTITKGWFLIRGRLIEIPSNGTISVAHSTSGTVTKYLLARVAIYGNNTGAVTYSIATSIPADADNFNDNGGYAYCALATLSVGTSSTTVKSVNTITNSFTDMMNQMTAAANSAKQEITAAGNAATQKMDTAVQTVESYAADITTTVDTAIEDLENTVTKTINLEVFIVCSDDNSASTADREVTQSMPYMWWDKNPRVGSKILVTFKNGVSLSTGNVLRIKTAVNYAPVYYHGHQITVAEANTINAGYVVPMIMEVEPDSSGTVPPHGNGIGGNTWDRAHWTIIGSI